MSLNDSNVSSKSGRLFLRLPAVKRQTGLGRTAIYEKVKEGNFPAPINLGARAVAWLSDEVDAWMDACIEASRNQNRGAK